MSSATIAGQIQSAGKLLNEISEDGEWDFLNVGSLIRYLDGLSSYVQVMVASGASTHYGTNSSGPSTEAIEAGLTEAFVEFYRNPLLMSSKVSSGEELDDLDRFSQTI